MFDKETIQKVWEKGRTVEGFDPNIIRKDFCNAWIMRNEYANCDSVFGWEIDHVYPESLGGDDNILNLRPMQWENNRAKGDDFPNYKVVVQAEGNSNIHIDSQYTVNSKLLDQLRVMYNI